MIDGGKFLILGGGISGLSAAYRLLQKVSNPGNITVIEASSRLGGWIQTKRYEDGALFELGPRGLRPAGPSGRSSLELVYQLGLENEVISVSTNHVSAKNRFIFANQKLHKLPSGIGGLFKSQSLLSKSLASVFLREPFVPKRTEEDDESIYSFISRRLNSEIADYIIDPMCRGIFAGDIKKLSIKSCFPPIYNLEQTSGSIVKGMLFSKSPENPKKVNPLIKRASTERWSLWTLNNGLSTLVERLEARLLERGVNILKSKPFVSLKFTEDRRVEAQGSAPEERVMVDHVISSVPTRCLAGLLPNQHSSLAGFLRRIPAVTVAVVSFEFEGSVLQHQGFGYLYPSCESKKLLGVIFDSSTFPQGDSRSSTTTRLTVMLGGSFFQDQFGEPDKADKDRIRNDALDALRNTLNIRAGPRKTVVSINEDCIPQYHVGHSDLLSSMRTYIAEHNLPLTLIGSWYDGVGLNDCIHYSQSSVDKIFDR